MTEIEDITAQLETVGDADPSWYLAQLMRIEQWLREQDWLAKPGVCISLARAYWEALQFQDALRFYRRALKEDSASLTLRDIEQLANLMTRLAVESTRQGGKPDRSAVTALFDEAEAVTSLGHDPTHGTQGRARQPKRSNDQLTAERLILLASLQKRRAWLSPNLSATRLAIEHMREYYELALSRRPANDYYPRLNLIMGQVVTSWLAAPAPKRSRKRASACSAAPPHRRAERNRTKDRAAAKEGPDFLVDQARIDCKLLSGIAADSSRRVATEASWRASMSTYVRFRACANSHRSVTRSTFCAGWPRWAVGSRS